MPLRRNCHKALASLALLAATALPSRQATAVILNFNGQLVNGTCDVELSQSRLDLMTFSRAEIQANRLTGAQPFKLMVRNCSMSGISDPVIRVQGAGQTLGKWAFRDFSSSAENIGVMLVNTDTPPSYSSAAIAHDETIALDESAGKILNQSLSFYAGLICGDASTCAQLKPGDIKATIEFRLDFL